VSTPDRTIRHSRTGSTRPSLPSRETPKFGAEAGYTTCPGFSQVIFPKKCAALTFFINVKKKTIREKCAAAERLYRHAFDSDRRNQQNGLNPSFPAVQGDAEIRRGSGIYDRILSPSSFFHKKLCGIDFFYQLEEDPPISPPLK
jgi:hypothetical protein